jgi:drug/metabolite transporter (DMT)-like permease
VGLEKPLKSAPGIERAAFSFGSADLMMIAVALIWGVGFSAVKYTVAIFSPNVFNAVRTTLAVLILLGVLWARGERLSDIGPDWRAVVWMGVFGYFVYQLFFVLGIARTTASNSSLLIATVPVIVAALYGLLRIERVSPRMWLGVLASFAGIVLIILGGEANFLLGSASLLGDALTLGAALAWAGYIVYSRKYLQRRSALLVTTWAVGTSATCLWLAAIPALGAVNWPQVPLVAWLGVAYTGGLGVAGAYLLWNVAVKRVGGTRVAVYSNLVTVIAVIVAALTLGEAITSLKVAGAVAVFAGIALTHWRDSSSEHEPA